MSDLYLVQYRATDGKTVLGVEQNGALHPLGVGLDSLLSGSVRAAQLLGTLQKDLAPAIDRTAVKLLAPAESQEVWAAGVTYKRSEEAREIESNNSAFYSRVYKAARPELFFKSLGAEVVALGETVGIRYDAEWSVPEPELVVVLNAHMEVVGFTIGNDMSSRDIEGENPLYLPQAKVYEGACSLGPRIWLQPGATVWPDVTIEIQIERSGQTVFVEKTTTAAIHRTLAELIDYLGRCKSFPRGALLFTGTGIVPPDDFTLAAGDIVRISIAPIGELVNTVRVVGRRLGD